MQYALLSSSPFHDFCLFPGWPPTWHPSPCPPAPRGWRWTRWQMSHLFLIWVTITGEAPKTGAGVLIPRDYNSDPQKAGPTPQTPTTVPSIRKERANVGSDYKTPIQISCGGHITWDSCGRCPDTAPDKISRWSSYLPSSYNYKMLSTTLKGDLLKIEICSV